MKVQDWHAAMLRDTAKRVNHWVETTEPDRLNWQPSADAKSDTRSVLNQVFELVQVNNRAADMLAGGGGGQMDKAPEHPFEGDISKAKSELTAATNRLASAVEAMSDADLAKMYPAPFGGDWPAAVMIQVCLLNMAYHGGQINYIQTLYGDREFRVQM